MAYRIDLKTIVPDAGSSKPGNDKSSTSRIYPFAVVPEDVIWRKSIAPGKRRHHGHKAIETKASLNTWHRR